MPLSDAPRSDAVPITERLRAAKDGCVGCARTLAKNPSRSMKIASVVSGLLLVLGGFYGMFNLFFPLQAVISVYQLLFGILILVTELKSWPIISTFQKKVDVWFHLLSTTRGKGGFYCFIGFLSFFASEWNVSTVCILFVSIIGVLHLLGFPRVPAPAPDDPAAGFGGVAAGGAQPMAPVDSADPSWSCSAAVSDFAMKVVADNPEVLRAGLSSMASSQMGSSGGGAGQPTWAQPSVNS